MYSFVLETEHLFAHYNTVNRLIFISYRNYLTAKVTKQAYTWMSAVLPQIDNLRGRVFDFQQVRRFDRQNVPTAKSFSDELNARFNLNGVPTAMVVSNPLQKRMVKMALQLSQPRPNRQLSGSIFEAFEFIRDFNTRQGIETFDSDDPAVLNARQVAANFDAETNVVNVMYFDTVSPDVTTQVYGWLGETLSADGGVNLPAIRGGIFDFRFATRFSNANLSTVQRSSSKLNTNFDMSHIAVPLVVTNMQQEQMVRIALKITPQEKRKRIVHSLADGYKFIDEYQRQRKA